MRCPRNSSTAAHLRFRASRNNRHGEGPHFFTSVRDYKRVQSPFSSGGFLGIQDFPLTLAYVTALH